MIYVEKGIDIFYVKERFRGRCPEYVFKDAEVVVRKTYLKTLLDLVKFGYKF